MKSQEHYEQCNLFLMIDQAVKAKLHPGFDTIYAIPNAGKRSPRQGAWMKAEGLRAGVLDINIDYPSRVKGEYRNGMRLEMKVGKNKLTKLQLEWKERFENAGYYVAVAYSAKEGFNLILNYLKGEL